MGSTTKGCAATLKGTGQGLSQQRALSRQKSEVFQFCNRLRDCAQFFREPACEGKADRTNATRLPECGHDVVFVLWCQRIELWRSSILHYDRQGGGPAT